TTTPVGIAGYPPLQALDRGLSGGPFTNAPPLVAPPGGAQRMIGTNPIAVAFPAGQEPPVVIDMATSAVAYGKVLLALRAGKPIPEGWAIDTDGRPTTDSKAVSVGGAMLPLGSTPVLSSHKGYCLAALTDILIGVLSGPCWR